MDSFFYGRKHELNQLNGLIRAGTGASALIRGRIGVGKTALLRELIRQNPELHFRIFSVPRGGYRPEEETVLQDAFLHAGQSNEILLIDQAENLDESRILRLLSENSDGKKRTAVFSGRMSDHVTEELTGRRSTVREQFAVKIELGDFSWWNIKPYLKTADISDRNGRLPLTAYAVSGGNPKILNAILPKIHDHGEIAGLDGSLIKEPYYRMDSFAQENAPYYRIMQVISCGDDRMSSIAERLGMATTSLPKYLNILVENGLIVRENPVTEKYRQNSRNGRYVIPDPWLRFWFRAIYPNMGEIEFCTEKGIPYIVSKVLKEKQIPEIYEDICRSSLWSMSEKCFDYDRVGRWWNRGSVRIPIVAYRSDGTDILFGTTCSDPERKLDVSDQKDLERAAAKVDWAPKNGGRREHYILFSEGGFTGEMREYAKKKSHIILVDSLPGK
ncbi:ATP-binding protein [[Clostridium] aminophilum]|uniref:Predicted ATPase, AAA+ ATPase superfamily n=1 Tax=[Clostridium] aminophilum TaxID=1526 RepID=A0A1I6ILK5_9FIRM|nr:DUF234 domain-containing protein [[Clostridium] aminophilum]SFR67596.1 Predicted ATPase, AAA+ ATPase superfamily [[Clostridium] aminophilum]